MKITRSMTLTSRLGMVVAALAVAVSLAACGGKKEQAEKPAEPERKEAGIKLTPEEAQRAGLQVQPLEAQEARETVTVTATIKPNQDRFARVTPRVEGRITRVLANVGDTVKAGQTLAVLDSVALGEAQATLQQAQAAYRVAEADHARASKLAAEEIVPQREVLRARGELDKASSEVAAARQKLRLLGATSSAEGAGFAIAAPVAGVVLEKKATIGTLANPNEPVFTVADLSRVWIEASLTEDLLAKVRVGAPASITVAAYPAERFNGRVTYVAGMLDKDTRTIPARIEVENRDGRLKPEMFATAEITAGTGKAKVLSVPDSAITIMQGQPTVFVEGPGGFEQRAVELGDRAGGRAILKSGVQSGEKVVTAGAYALKARVLKSQISDEH